MIDHLRSLAIFTAVADSGSFRAAARELGLSPSVVSQHVAALEGRFGLALLYRSTRRLALTESGQELRKWGREMLLAAEAGFDAVGGNSDNPDGKLRIHVPPVLQDGPFIDDIARFMATYPRVRVSIHFGQTPPSLLDGGCDLALAIGPLVDSAMKSRRVIGGTQVLCASPGYIGTIGPVETPTDLAKCSFVSDAGESFSLRLSKGLESVEIPMSHRLEADTGHAARSFALAGAGVAVLPRFFVAPHLSRGELTELLPDWTLPGFDIYAIWPANIGERSLTRRLLDFLIAEIAANPPLAR